ncbi:hypothetical protein PVK06_005819 [Gossypium arboreum]|uniref:RNase H type-1 domain-containing protein n=1 Tax=Gossypium arboreum TaxID=29729 RepID=A0ABR0QVR9_GOSAR|nr:hypothetical protein PVK06_005819 [Gossypium arboreum]
MIWERAASLSHDFRIFNLLDKPMLPRLVMKKTWRKPRQRVIKVNFDATVNGTKTCYDLVARYHDGFVLGRRFDTMDKDIQIEWAEMLVLEESISFARSKSWSKLEFETDDVSLVNHFKNKKFDLTTISH